MFGILRLVRGFCGLLFGMQVIGVFPVLLKWLQQPDAVTGHMWGLVIIWKVLAMVLFGWLFFALRGLINRLHTKKHGVPHPALADKKWAL